MSSLATIVDTKALWETVVAAAVAGVGTTVIFSIAILGFVKSAEATRSARSAEATVFGVLAAVGLIATGAAVVLAVVVMTTK
jgi:hypothetical protein